MYFTDKITQDGHSRQLESPEKENSTATDTVRTARNEYIADIAKLLKRTRGRELPGTYDPMITRDLFQEQSRLWEKITRNHVITAWNAAQEFLQFMAHRYFAPHADCATIPCKSDFFVSAMMKEKRLWSFLRWQIVYLNCLYLRDLRLEMSRVCLKLLLGWNGLLSTTVMNANI